MNFEASVGKSSSYVVSQGKARYERIAAAHPGPLGPAVTVSHQTGAGVPEITKRLAQRLQQTGFKGELCWTVLDQQLIERALEEHCWPKALAEHITEEKRFFIDELMDDLFGLRPPSWVLVPQVAETTLRLAMAGHVILVGHGATVITKKLPNVFHVRLTGSLPRRIERVQRLRNLKPEAAAQYVRREDRGRERYVKAHFHGQLANELLYDLVLNTDRVSDEDAAAILAESARTFFSASQTSNEFQTAQKA
ncbi:MAG TPA: cytidylate kinase-like family protein [Verrucomicrobiae bacterium]|nr:cytidylate kinase-like family protein [Verrucomicrobiae bacterium]